MDATLLDILACPVCKGNLRTFTEDALTVALECQFCSVLYPIYQDIPILLKEEAITMTNWQKGTRYQTT